MISNNQTNSSLLKKVLESQAMNDFNFQDGRHIAIRLSDLIRLLGVNLLYRTQEFLDGHRNYLMDEILTYGKAYMAFESGTMMHHNVLHTIVNFEKQIKDEITWCKMCENFGTSETYKKLFEVGQMFLKIGMKFVERGVFEEVPISACFNIQYEIQPEQPSFDTFSASDRENIGFQLAESIRTAGIDILYNTHDFLAGRYAESVDKILDISREFELLKIPANITFNLFAVISNFDRNLQEAIRSNECRCFACNTLGIANEMSFNKKLVSVGQFFSDLGQISVRAGLFHRFKIGACFNIMFVIQNHLMTRTSSRASNSKRIRI
jgi:hypothetical protein